MVGQQVPEVQRNSKRHRVHQRYLRYRRSKASRVYRLNRGQLALQHEAWHFQQRGRAALRRPREIGQPDLLDDQARELFNHATKSLKGACKSLTRLAQLTGTTAPRPSQLRYTSLAERESTCAEIRK